MNDLDRIIIHLDLDTFFVSVERLLDRRLLNRPIIIGGLSDRGVVASCSYEARTFGIHSAMPMKMARILCSQALFIRGDMDLYSKYSNIVTEIIADEAPVYEKASIDEHYIDITGMDKYFGGIEWAKKLRRNILNNTGLPISMGVSLNKTVSKIATGEAKPNGEIHVANEKIMPFLNPLSIKKIPMIGDKTYQLLRSMGIITISTLSQVPVEMIERVLGKNGIVIWKKANGIDPSPVKPYYEQKSMGSERTFEKDTIDVDRINDIFISMVEKLAFELRQKQKLTSCVTVKIRYSNFDTFTLQKRIPYTSFDHVLIETTKELFKKLYQRRLLIRLIGVKFSNLIHGFQQLNLFEDTPEKVNLYLAMDKIRNQFGANSIRRAVSLRQ